MILIFSRPGDFSTNYVIDWLNYFNHPYLRINTEDTYKYPFYLNLNDKIICINGQEIPIDQINVIWYRKFGTRWARFYEEMNVQPSVIAALEDEYKTIIQTLFYLFKGKRCLNDPYKGRLNKCEVLLKAKDVGLYIPTSFIVNTTEDLGELLKKKPFISKSVYDMTLIDDKQGVYNMFTKEISKYFLNITPNLYFPSFIQEKIYKEFEIRAFYINEEIYAMAIFSQLNTDTEIDSRVVNYDKPPRCIPYSFDNIMKEKIILLMNSLELNCGSLDFIYSSDGKIYFLEVNPVGEFGMIDFRCNYNLHQKVAKNLIKMDIP